MVYCHLLRLSIGCYLFSCCVVPRINSVALLNLSSKWLLLLKLTARAELQNKSPFTKSWKIINFNSPHHCSIKLQVKPLHK